MGFNLIIGGATGVGKTWPPWRLGPPGLPGRLQRLYLLPAAPNEELGLPTRRPPTNG